MSRWNWFTWPFGREGKNTLEIQEWLGKEEERQRPGQRRQFGVDANLGSCTPEEQATSELANLSIEGVEEKISTWPGAHRRCTRLPTKDLWLETVLIFCRCFFFFFIRLFQTDITHLGPVISTARMHMVTKVPRVPIPQKTLQSNIAKKICEENISETWEWERENIFETWEWERQYKTGRRQRPRWRQRQCPWRGTSSFFAHIWWWLWWWLEIHPIRIKQISS